MKAGDQREEQQSGRTAAPSGGIAGEKEENMEFCAVITAHQSALLRYVDGIINDAAAAQDVVQETFVKFASVWKKSVQQAEWVRPWLYRVAHNAAVDHIRSESRRRRLHEQDAEMRAITAQASGDSRAEMIGMVMDSLRRLDPAEKQVLLLRLQEGMSYREISRITGRTEGNIGCMLHNAVKKIGATLKNAGVVRREAEP